MNSFDARSQLTVGDRSYEIFRLDALQSKFDVARLPFALKVLLENLLRYEDGQVVTSDDIEALARWDADGRAEPRRSRSRRRACCCRTSPACPPSSTWRRCATRWRDLGGDPARINPLQPAELVIDHSVQVDAVRHRATRSSSTPTASSSATASATRSCAGASRRSTTSRSCRPTPASCTRSTSSTSRAWCSRARPTATAAGLPGHAGRAPTPTPRWSTASACWAGAWAASRPRPRCSASRSRC